MAAISDDDDIVAGPQKMSLKCPVSQAESIASLTFSNLIQTTVELHAYQYALPFCSLCTFTMFRCDVVVLSDGADDDIHVPRLRKGSQPR